MKDRKQSPLAPKTTGGMERSIRHFAFGVVNELDSTTTSIVCVFVCGAFRNHYTVLHAIGKSIVLFRTNRNAPSPLHSSRTIAATTTTRSLTETTDIHCCYYEDRYDDDDRHHHFHQSLHIIPSSIVVEETAVECVSDVVLRSRRSNRTDATTTTTTSSTSHTAVAVVATTTTTTTTTARRRRRRKEFGVGVAPGRYCWSSTSKHECYYDQCR